MRILLFFFCVLSFSAERSFAAIEVYTAGQHFKSFEDYQQKQKDALFQDAKLIGPLPEPRKVPLVSQQEQQKLDKISYNKAVYHVLVDFQQNWEKHKPRFIMDASELEDAIREAMGKKHEASMLISDAQKMRIMSYSPQEKASALTANPEDRQKQ